jgi:hypothetical protein
MPVLENKKHEKYARLVTKGVHKPDAYRKVYPDASYNTASSQAYTLANKPEVDNRIAELLDQVPEMRLPNVIKTAGKMMKAKKTVIYNSKGDSKQVADNTARTHAVQTALKMHNVGGFGKADNVTNNNTMNVMQLGNDAIDKLGSVLADLKSIGLGSDVMSEQSGEVVDV